MDDALRVFILSEFGVSVLVLPPVPDAQLANRIVATVLAVGGTLCWEDGVEAIVQQ